MVMSTVSCGILKEPAETTGTTETSTESTNPGTINPPETTKTYNVIFALATIPPVLSALEAIQNGYPTYVIIERGKTYSGIESLENFVNVGFDPNNNLSQGFTVKEFEDMVAQVKTLRADNEDIFINFYVQDGTALYGAAIAANAGLDGSVIVDKVLSSKKANYGFDALNNKYCDMVESGIIDPTKVTRSVLQNAASVAATLLTTESIVTDIPTPPAPMAPAGGDMGGMY